MSSTTPPTPVQPASSSVVQSAPSVTIPQLNLKNSIKAHVKYSGILRGLVSKLTQEIPDLEDLKMSPELTSLVANTVESIINNGNKYNIDKKQLVSDVLDKIFNLTDEEKKQIGMQIDFLCDNGNIKKVTNFLNFFKSTIPAIASKLA